MNSKTKKRLIIVTGFIVIVLVVALALVGGSTAAKTINIAQALSGDYVDQKIQVTGNVVQNSFETNDNVLTFEIFDPEVGEDQQLAVKYEGAVAATFGNNVTAICTGKMSEDGKLIASELITKCPSKYESATDALTVSSLLKYEESIYDKPVKVTGKVKANTLRPAGQEERFVLVDSEDDGELSIQFNDAISEDIQDGSEVVLIGSLKPNGKFEATEVALRG